MIKMATKPVKKKKTPLTKKQQIIREVIFFAVVIALTFSFMPIMKASLKSDYPLVVVTSGSMETTIYRGDLLVIGGKDPAEILVGDHIDHGGDIILYNATGLNWESRGSDEPIVHRCVGKEVGDDGVLYFTAQGDNLDTNTRPDTDDDGNTIRIPEDHILGVVKSIIPKIGYPKLWMAENNIFSTILVIGLAILLVVSIVDDYLHPEKEEKNEAKTRESAESEIDDSEIISRINDGQVKEEESKDSGDSEIDLGI
ncbi:hypothetical protein WKT22_05051 [Candidatus Lokiarchaeum ossiferum]